MCSVIGYVRLYRKAEVRSNLALLPLPTEGAQSEVRFVKAILEE
jgi:hypothetical protein